jgi:hypothetical protein
VNKPLPLLFSNAIVVYFNTTIALSPYSLTILLSVAIALYYLLFPFTFPFTFPPPFSPPFSLPPPRLSGCTNAV